MKKIEISTIVDFLRRVLASNDISNITAKDEKYSKCILYTINEDEHVFIYIGVSYVSYTDKDIAKDIAFTDNERLDLLFYFNKIFSRKEEIAFDTINNAFPYTKE